MCCDVLSVVLLIICIVLLAMGKQITVPEQAKLAFLLAIIILISAYNIEIAIIVVIIAIIYVLVQNNSKKHKEINNQA
jgi:hypothetical protein